MILRKEWFQFDDRCFAHPGVILDLGCYTWDWSFDFIGRKKVIGFDLNETIQPIGTELRQKAVMPFARTCYISGFNEVDSTIMPMFNSLGKEIEAVSLDSILDEFPNPSILKMNIEGAEYPLLFSLRKPPADQLIVSFHDFAHFPFPKQLSEMVRNQLSVWYNWTQTCVEYSWWMGLLKDEFRTL